MLQTPRRSCGYTHCLDFVVKRLAKRPYRPHNSLPRRKISISQVVARELLSVKGVKDMTNNNSKPLTDCQAARISRVTEGVTEHIVWHQLDNDKFTIPVNELTRGMMEHSMRATQTTVPLAETIRSAFEQLRVRFSNKIKAFSPSVVHDGEFIISVQPHDNMFDVDLGLELGMLADELEDRLNNRLEEAGLTGMRMLVGFRQEVGCGEKPRD